MRITLNRINKIKLLGTKHNSCMIIMSSIFGLNYYIYIFQRTNNTNDQ